MVYQVLKVYLVCFDVQYIGGVMFFKVWLDEQGCVVGCFFNILLILVFQLVCSFDDGYIVVCEVFVCSYLVVDDGLYLWKLLDQVVSDDELVELDWLCCMLYVINYYCQVGDDVFELYFLVYVCLLVVVNNNYGVVYWCILVVLELLYECILL